MMPLMPVLLIVIVLAGTGALLWCLPALMQRRTLFGVTVDPTFLATPGARGMVRRFRHRILGATALTAALGAVGAWTERAWLLPAAVLMQLAVAFAAYRAEWRAALVHRSVRPVVRVASLGERPATGVASRLTVLALTPLLLATLELRRQWQGIPDIFPMHWDATGHVNRWAHKTPLEVFFPVIMGTGLVLFLLALPPLIRWGARSPATRQGDRNWQITTEIISLVSWLLALVFSGVALTPLLQRPLPWVMGLALLAPLALLTMVIWIVVRASHLDLDDPDPTPDDGWVAGLIYFNRSDPALFVAKRAGIGYTLNFAHRGSWLLLVMPLLLTVLAAVAIHAGH